MDLYSLMIYPVYRYRHSSYTGDVKEFLSLC